MSQSEPMPERRKFLAAIGTTGALVAVPGASAQTKPASGNAAQSAAPHAYVFFSTHEAAFVKAAVDIFIPKDEVGPGALECGVDVCMDLQLAGAYGAAARQFMAGPYAPGTPEQGNQLPLTPAEVYRVVIPEIDAVCQREYGGRMFSSLSSTERNEVLIRMRENKLSVPSGLARTFLSLLYNGCITGYFADPIYGGNRNKAAWKMIGFPGPFRNYSTEIANYRGRKFVAEPKSVADLI